MHRPYTTAEDDNQRITLTRHAARNVHEIALSTNEVPELSCCLMDIIHGTAGLVRKRYMMRQALRTTLTSNISSHSTVSCSMPCEADVMQQ